MDSKEAKKLFSVYRKKKILETRELDIPKIGSLDKLLTNCKAFLRNAEMLDIFPMLHLAQRSVKLVEYSKMDVEELCFSAKPLLNMDEDELGCFPIYLSALIQKVACRGEQFDLYLNDLPPLKRMGLSLGNVKLKVYGPVGRWLGLGAVNCEIDVDTTLTGNSHLSDDIVQSFQIGEDAHNCLIRVYGKFSFPSVVHNIGYYHRSKVFLINKP